MTLKALLGKAIDIPARRSANARDPVIVIELSGGGVISYEKPDGGFVHTLCDESGFRRKLDDLGLG
ncbi:MAG: hypothetical protein EA376_01795 [Phycisphaeraceae bacterium]|nr:MAG: hypothetical protein EA376_01795 [Phycisphaeraceae bacterium]